MTEIVKSFNLLLAIGGIGIFLVSLVLFVDLYTKRILERLISVGGLVFAFIVTLGSSIMTLVYSEVFGFVPCGLCWLQRVCLYPQVLILATAIFYKDKTAARYGIALSVPGFIIGLYQHYLQMGGSKFIACPTSGGDCTKRFLFEFDFITFPLLSAILFAFLIILYLYILSLNKANLDKV